KTLAKKANSIGCQPRKAPAIIIRSASPSPSPSTPRPTVKMKRTARSNTVPASIPSKPLANPVCQLPPLPNHSGKGHQKGHGCSPPTGSVPWKIGGAASKFQTGAPGGSSSGACGWLGHGQGQMVPNAKPTNVPVNVTDSGISNRFQSHQPTI